MTRSPKSVCAGAAPPARTRLAALALAGLGVLAFLAGNGARAATIEVQGRVVDASGQPAAGVTVSDFWHGAKGRMKPGESAITDSDGRFKLSMRVYGSGGGLMAIDAEQLRGATALVSTNLSPEPFLLKLAALTSVRGDFTCKELGETPEWSNVYIGLGTNGGRVANDASDPPRFSFKLPPGAYNFNGYASFDDYTGVRTNFTIPAGRTELDLGHIDLAATPISRNYGKSAPPWHVTDARGLPKHVRVADLRGKWVLVEFWGFW